MKRSNNIYYDGLGWSESEIETAQILSELNLRISLWNSVSYSWGCTKKRSAIQKTPSSDGGAVTLVPPSFGAVKAQASSPATPLSFPATESDEKKTKYSKIKTSLKRKREYYVSTVKDLTKMKHSINQEIENVMRHCEQLKDYNLKLKAKEKELSSSNGPKGECENPKLGINQPKQWNNDIIKGSVNPSKFTDGNEEVKNKEQIKPPNYHHHHNNNFGFYQILCNSNSTSIFQFHSAPSHPTTSLGVASSSLGRNNNMGPLSIPDLNLSIEESVHVDICQPLDEAASSKDLSKVMAAQARQRRLQIFRLKKTVGINNTKQRQSYYSR